MQKSAAEKTQTAPDLYPIRIVSDLTGVNAITLRAWERRYGLFTPIRKNSGHRLYTQKNIDLIKRIIELLDTGVRISQVKALLESEVVNPNGETAGHSIWKTYYNRMINRVSQLDEAGLNAIFDEAMALFPAPRVIEELLVPVQVELSNPHRHGTSRVTEERFFSLYIRNRLGSMFHHRTKEFAGPRILLACIQKDRSEANLLMFALSTSEAGYHPILLGSDMPLDELPALCIKTECQAIILFSVEPISGRSMRWDIPELVSRTELPLVMIGRISTMDHDELKRAGVYTPGTDLKLGLRQLRNLVPLTSGDDNQ